MTTRLMRPAAKASRSTEINCSSTAASTASWNAEYDVHHDVGAEQQQRQLQLSPHEAIDRQRRNRDRRQQRDDAEDEMPGVIEAHPRLDDALFELDRRRRG